VALSGEPGAPSDVFYGGDIAATMDVVAAAHRGVAPIVVVPDQLGGFSRNPMCIDSPLGHARTYLMRDVRDWILRHLPVSRSRHDWTVAGFSEGGTCALQLGVGYPATYGSLVDVSGELAPINGSVAHTIKVGFHGSTAAYAAASPLTILRKHRYPDTEAYFAVGAQDRKYGPSTRRLASAARAAGMRVQTYFVGSYGHNWNTGALGLAWGLGRLSTLWRLPVGAAAGSASGNGPVLPTLPPSQRRKLK
jgi:enterochelin esterase-like enzyme